MSNFIKYDVGTNFDKKIFDFIKENDTNHRIKNLYGKLKNDGLLGGRANSIVPDMTMDQFEAYICKCKENGLTFNYLINPLCMDQHEFNPVEGKKIRNFIHDVYDIGVREFTINSPTLIHYVKNTFPDVAVTLGLYAYPTNLRMIEDWRRWGVDEITLDHSFNRDFKTLKRVLSVYKDSDFKVRVIGNNFCVKECPFRVAHGSFASHSAVEGVSMDYILVNCVYKKVTTPRQILTSEWIRPEDVHYYEELMEETGNKNFSIKLVDRTRSTEFITRVIKAYLDGSYEGNLLDIINWPDHKAMGKPVTDAPQGMPVGMPPQGMPMGMPPQGMPTGMPPQGMPMGRPAGIPPMRHMQFLKPESMMQYGRVMHFPEIYVDNKKLDGFLEHFVKNNNCAESICGECTFGKCENGPVICNHCTEWAKKVVSFNEAEVASWRAAAESMFRQLESGAVFKD